MILMGMKIIVLRRISPGSVFIKKLKNSKIRVA